MGENVRIVGIVILLSISGSCLSVFNTLTPDYLQNRTENNLQIQGKRAVLQIPLIKPHLNRNRQFITAINLCPAGQAGGQAMHLFLSPQNDQIILIEKGRAGADDAHFAGEDAEQLGEFIEAGFAEELADRCQPLIGAAEEVGGDGGGVGPHGTELGHPEDGVVAPDPVGPVQDRPGRGQPNQKCDENHRNGKED